MSTYQSFVITILGVLFMASCAGDTSSSQDLNIDGKWNIYKTIRGKRPSKTLEGGYFIFEGDNSFKTNLPLDPNFPVVSEKRYTFERKGDNISISDLNPPLNFVVKLSQKDSLSLSCKIQKAPMTFYLVRDSLPL